MKRFKLMWNLGGRTRHVITYSPRFQQSDAMFVDAEEGRLFSGCIEEGIVAVCHYNTGKVEKDYMYSNSDFLRNPVSSVHVEK